MKVGVVRFPGSNCDQDAYHAIKTLGHQAEYVWHQDCLDKSIEAVILPGGFSFGDYLRPGRLATYSPVMKDIVALAKAGQSILGICNGFQILCESHLLPGALMRNGSNRFVCKDVYLRVEDNFSVLTKSCTLGQILKVPIAHGDGCYIIDPNQAPKVVLRYCNKSGGISSGANPNGSEQNIAGVSNQIGNVIGLMPHPERACWPLFGSTDGRLLLENLLGPAS